MKVLHFVTGGFSGATQVAVDLCLAAHKTKHNDVLLVLRRKRNTDETRVQGLRDRGLNVRVVPGWSHLATIFALYKLARQHQPDVLVAHGFSEHLWGRYAGLLARVPHLVHVEHNSRERYSSWRLWQAKWLAARTDAIVGVSEGVRHALCERGFPENLCVAIPNGINLEHFAAADTVQWTDREPSIIMASRFARQKDHLTLIQALALLRDKGLQPQLDFAGLGKSRLIKKSQEKVKKLKLQNQVNFMGRVQGLPEVLMQRRFFVLSTHYEGMPLALIEAMAAGCACIATDVIGAREVIEHGVNGLLVAENDPKALATALEQLFKYPDQARLMAENGRKTALSNYGLEKMNANYEKLLDSMINN